MSDNLYTKVNEEQDRVKSKVIKSIQNYLMFIVLFVNIAVSIVTRLYKIGFRNPISVAFLLEISITITVTMVCYMCFIPFGKSEEKKSNLSYEHNRVFWGALSDTIRNGFNVLFKTFCVEQIEQEREDKRRAIIGDNTLISYDTYDKKYKGKSREDIKNLVKAGELTKKEARVVNKANGNNLLSCVFNPVKVKPINPVIILSGVKKTQINDAGRSDNSYTVNWLVSRPFIILAVSIITESITNTFLGANSGIIFDICMSALQIIVASVCGYSVGVTSIRRENDKIKSRILFLSLFCEKNNISVKTEKQS